MNRAAKALLALVGTLLLTIVLIVVVAIVAIRRPFPQTDGALTVPGLASEVTIYRDEFGVPHIYADNEADLFFAQGYVHAQDRFWQMEFWRHISQGRLSEIAGEATLESDKFIRTMGWNRMAETSTAYYRQEAPEYYTLLEAYSAGVNAYIDANRSRLSVNQTILGLVNEPWEIEPWLPVHTVGWGIVMADDLSGNWGDELRRADLLAEFGAEVVDALQPGYPYGQRPVIVPSSALAGTIGWGETTAVDWRGVNTTIVGSKPELGFLGASPFVGSNNWVISGEHTASGMPLLANDPHLGIQMPAIWYEVGLHAPGFNVVGFSFAGVPGVIVGHNDAFAWGVTNVGPDVQDLFIEKINPENPNQYEFEGEWRDMTVIEEVIQVNGGEDVVLTVKETHHGPIISDLRDSVDDPLAMQWTAQEPSRVLQSVILLNRGQNYNDFREALRFWDVPSQNMVYADTEGNIAYQMPGLIPLRRNGNGRVPVPGWTGEYEWDGWVPYEELPYLLNPEWGYIVTANHAVVDEQYPYLIDLEWNDGDRGQRITDMITAVLDDGGKLTAADMARIQNDSYSLLAQDFLPLINTLTSDDAREQAALDRLAAWDGQLRRDSVPAALFELFYYHATLNALQDDVGEESVQQLHSRIFMHELAEQPNAVWWDDTTTAETETAVDILQRSLTDTIAWFDDSLGGEMDDWTWGSIHTATFPSAPLGQSGIGPIEALVNGGPIPADGGTSIVNANSYGWGSSTEVRGHPSMRMVVELSDWDLMQTVIPTGQSGHPTHPHYEDQMPLWQNGDYHRMWFSRPAVEAAAVDVLVLRP